MTLVDMMDDLMHEDHIAGLPQWTGMPLGQLVTDYHHPDELDAAWRRWVEIKGNFNSVFLSKMWHRSYTVHHMNIGEHTFDLYDVDLRCAAGAHDSRKIDDPPGPLCQCVGSITAQAICSHCSWHHIGTEAECVEVWHDHAFPGWRDLPTLPGKIRGGMGPTRMTPKLEAWLEDNYPPAFRVPGAPILTERPSYGSRHVPNYSPFGGFDLSASNQP